MDEIKHEGESQEIRLRILGQRSEGLMVAVCLETDIAVQGRTVEEVRRKMKDALVLYLQSFAIEEIEAGAYVRKAPLGLRFKWQFLWWARFLRETFKSAVYKADYDPSSRHLSLA